MRIEQFISGVAAEGLLGMLLLVGLDGRVLDANAAATEWYGHSREQMLRLNVRDLAASEADVDEVERMLHAAESGLPFASKHRRADGSTGFVDVRSNKVASEGQHAVLSRIADIGACSGAEAVAREIEARFHFMADAAPVLLWTSGTDALCDHFNRPWLEFTGRTLEQELGNGWAEGVHAEDFPGCLDTYLGSFEARRPFTMEYRLRRADGEYRWVLDNGVPRYAPDGSFAGYIGSCIDVTEQRHSERALRSAHRRTESIIESTDAGTWEWNIQTGETVFNDRWALIVGYTLEELQPTSIETWERLVHPDDLALSNELLEQHFAGGQPIYDCECRMRHKNGDWIWVHDRGRVTSRTEDGKALMMFGTHTDITARKRTEAALASSERTLSTVFQNIPDAIVVTELATSCVIQANESFYRMFGVSREATQGRKIVDLDLWADLHQRVVFINELNKNGRTSGFETMFRRASGDLFPGALSAEVVDIEGVPCALSILQDVTDLASSERARRESEAQHRAAVETSPDGFLVVDMLGRLLEVNEAYARRSGYSRDELLHMTLADLDAHLTPTERAEGFERVVERGNVTFETNHRTKDGVVWPAEVSVSYWPIGGGRVFAFVRNLAERMRAELLVQVRAKLAEVEQEADLSRLLQTAVDQAELLTGSSSGFFHFFDADRERLTLQAWSTNTLADGCSMAPSATHYPLEDAGVWADCARTGQPVIINDYDGLATKKGLPPGHAPVLRQLSIPIVRHGEVVAIMGVGNKTSDYTDEDVDTLRTVGAIATDMFLRRRSQDELEHFFHVAPDMLSLISPEGYFHRLNPEWEKVLGFTREQLMALPFLDFVHPGDRQASAAEFQRLLHENGAVEGFTNRYLTARGEYRWFEWHAAAMEHNFVFAAARDVTERKSDEDRLLRYQGSLRALAAELAASGERERRRLGVELHDGLGQVLSAAKMSAELLAAEPLAQPSAEQAQRIIELLSESIREVRMLTSELAPTVLFELGLGSALLWLSERYAQLYGLRCDVECDETASHLCGETAVFLFRFVREALNNVVRHSGVLHANVKVEVSRGWECATVHDAGIGFDATLVDNPGEGRGFGLFSIREECLSRGGALRINSSPGGGSSVEVRVPHVPSDASAR